MKRADPVFGKSASSVSSDAPIPLVCIVGEDAVTRGMIERLVGSAGWEPRTFSCPAQYLAHPRVSAPGCVIVDVAFDDVDGIALHQRVLADGAEIPVIFLSAQLDVAIAVDAMKRGASEFMTKPFDDDSLMEAVSNAIGQSRAAMARQMGTRILRDRSASLTRRERQVMSLIVDGRLNKQIAAELGISQVTVKAHRGRVMRKMEARCVPDLVRMFVRLQPDALFRW